MKSWEENPIERRVGSQKKETKTVLAKGDRNPRRRAECEVRTPPRACSQSFSLSLARAIYFGRGAATFADKEVLVDI